MPANSSRLFLMSCLALIVTAMTFAIRAGILTDLGVQYGLSDAQLGTISSMAFLGFPISMMVGGLLYNSVGPKRMMMIAFFAHLLGLGLTIAANGFWLLLISTFLIGIANGAVEAAANPMIADMYHKNKTTMLNRFHVWFPGGIVIGALVATAMGDIAWQWKIAVMLLPTFVYGYMVFTEKFPESQAAETSTATNIKALLSPLFIVMLVLMTMTATTELGTGQWIDRVLSGSGASGLLVLALTAGLMAVGRFFAGPVVHRLNPVGVLVASAVVSSIGLCDWGHLFLADNDWVRWRVPAKNRGAWHVTDRRGGHVWRQPLAACHRRLA